MVWSDCHEPWLKNCHCSIRYGALPLCCVVLAKTPPEGFLKTQKKCGMVCGSIWKLPVPLTPECLRKCLKSHDASVEEKVLESTGDKWTGEATAVHFLSVKHVGCCFEDQLRSRRLLAIPSSVSLAAFVAGLALRAKLRELDEHLTNLYKLHEQLKFRKGLPIPEPIQPYPSIKFSI